MKLIELSQIFGCTYGNKFDLNKMVPAESYDDSVLFIGRSGQNNGVTSYVVRSGEVDPYPAGFITVAMGGRDIVFICAAAAILHGAEYCSSCTSR